MSDKYLQFANSKIGKSILSMLGLPKPPRLIRENENNLKKCFKKRIFFVIY